MSKRVLILSLLMAGLLGGFQNFSPVSDPEQVRKELGMVYLEDAKFECEWLKQISESLSTQKSGAEFTGATNMQSFATNIARIESAAGNIHLQGKGEGATLKLVRGYSGTLVLCEMNLEKIENATGDVMVVGGSIGSIKNVTGNVIIYDGNVGVIEGGDGLIAWRAPSGDVRVQKMSTEVSSGL